MKFRLLGILQFIILISYSSFCYAMNLCYDYLGKEDYNASVTECSKQINEEGWDKATAYSNRGVAYKGLGKLDKALSDFDMAIALKPDYANAYNNRGLAYYFKGDIDRSIADYSKAIELKPKNADAYSNRGLAYKAKCNYEQALSDYIIASSLEPDNEYTYIDIIVVSNYISEKKYKDAQKRLKHYIRWNNSSEWIRTISKYYLGTYGMEEKDVLVEANNCREDKEKKERLCEAYYYLGEKRLIEGNRKGAEEFFEKSIETNVYSFIEYQNSKLILSMIEKGKV